MAATTSPSKSDGFMPAATSETTVGSAASIEQPVQAKTEGTDEPTTTTASETSTNATAAGGIAPDARVEATAGSRSLEDIVVDLLKPQLSQWLEANMPRIVERALRAEQSRSSDKDRS